MLIDCADSSTYPNEIYEVISRYISSNHTDETEAKIKKLTLADDRDLAMVVEDHFDINQNAALYRELAEIMSEKEILCFHATRVIDPSRIKTDGLRVNSWDSYSEMMITSLNSFGCTNVEEVIGCISHEYKRKYNLLKQKPQLCFFSSPQMMNWTVMPGYEQFCESIGGELARWPLRSKMPEIYQLLCNNGIGLLVKFSLPFKDICCRHKNSILCEFIKYYVALHYWKYEYKIHFDGATNQDVAPENILEIQEYRAGEGCER